MCFSFSKVNYSPGVSPRGSHVIVLKEAVMTCAVGVFLSATHPWHTLACWKCEPIPIMDGDPGDGTGEVFGDEWRFPVISIMSWPMSFSSSSGKGRSKGRSSEAGGRYKCIIFVFHQVIALIPECPAGRYHCCPQWGRSWGPAGSWQKWGRRGCGYRKHPEVC